MSLIVSISGIRGVVGTSLTPEMIVKYAAGYADYCRRGPVVVGRDGRITGTSIASLVSGTLLQMGCDVIDLGICPTPTVALAVERLNAAGGISITASHNPMVWNGMKFFAPDGMFLDAEQNRQFWSIADTPGREYTPWDRQGQYLRNERFIEEHLDAALGIPFIDQEAIRRRRFRVVLDCVNASGGVIVPKLLRRLGCEVIALNCDLDGVFAHTPEPLPENLGDLCKQVSSNAADLGIAVDPDSDRLVLIREDGEPYGEEYTIASCVEIVLRKDSFSPGQADAEPSVAVNLSTTRAVDDIARAHGARVFRTPVGEINVAKKMKEVGAVIGGEGSGGVIYPRVHAGRDALVGIALVLQFLAEFDGPLSKLKASLPQYSITKGRVELGSLDPDAILAALAKRHQSEGRINTEDGLKIDFPSSWVHLRKSNTEPILRIIAEATDKQEADALVRQFTTEILRG